MNIIINHVLVVTIRLIYEVDLILVLLLIMLSRRFF